MAILAFALTSCVTTKQLQQRAAHYQSIPNGERIALFNGKNLNGWETDVPAADHDPNVPPSFVVRNGTLISMGKPKGHLITTSAYHNYRLVIEYRFPNKPGNGGVLVHTSTPRVLYQMFPASIEVQMQHQQAGDFWCIGENIKVPNMHARRPRENGQQWGGMQADARHILNQTDGSEKPLGQWNRMEIMCKGDEVIVHVNGDLVNHGYGSTATSGKIAIQAEGSVMEFRRIDLYPLLESPQTKP